jgi:BirA family biotin operon repressor/biotin-[acetyl-CoA-carboxylase] ligase
VDWRRVRIPETASTQDDVLEAAESGAPEGLAVRAGRQTAGRGRAGSAWASPEGGLSFSALLRPRRADWGILPLAAGLGVAAALVTRGHRARVKWPNDVFVEGKKVAGVVLEGRTGRSPHGALGVGVNADFPVEDLPEAVRGEATTLRELEDQRVDVDKVWDSVLWALEARYERFEDGEDEALLAEWRDRTRDTGQRVQVDGEEGIVDGVNDLGALQVVVAGEVRTVTDPGAVTWLGSGP